MVDIIKCITEHSILNSIRGFGLCPLSFFLKRQKFEYNILEAESFCLALGKRVREHILGSAQWTKLCLAYGLTGSHTGPN
jgi:hypothetical protein